MTKKLSFQLLLKLRMEASGNIKPTSFSNLIMKL